MKGHGFVPGFYGTMRARLPLFALEAVVIVLIALVPFPSGSRREVLVDYRPGAGIRVAPHFYTTDDELEHTVEEVRQVAGECQVRLRPVEHEVQEQGLGAAGVLQFELLRLIVDLARSGFFIDGFRVFSLGATDPGALQDRRN